MEIKVVNLDKTQRILEAFPKESEKAIRVAIKDGMARIKKYAFLHHRFTSRSGMLGKSISSEYDDATMTGTVFLDSAVAPYAKFVHDGTKPYTIVPKEKKALRWVALSYDHFIFAKRVHHPGIKADPFLYEAAEHVMPSIKEELQEELVLIFRGENK